MSFERSHERIKQILIFANKSLLLPWWVTLIDFLVEYSAAETPSKIE